MLAPVYSAELACGCMYIRIKVKLKSKLNRSSRGAAISIKAICDRARHAMCKGPDPFRGRSVISRHLASMVTSRAERGQQVGG